MNPDDAKPCDRGCGERAWTKEEIVYAIRNAFDNFKFPPVIYLDMGDYLWGCWVQDIKAFQNFWLNFFCCDEKRNVLRVRD